MDNRNEQISALMDEELNDVEQKQAIDFLIESKTARRAWAEYHIIRDCLQHSVDVAPKPSSKIRQWLKLPTINDERWTATVAASVAVVAFFGVMLWSKGTHHNASVVDSVPMVIQQEANPDNNMALSDTPESNLPDLDNGEYYLQTHHQSVDMDGLKQVSHSFE